MNSQIKNILLISPGFPADEEDSTCIPALQDFVRGLNTFHPQVEITVVSMHYPASTTPYQWFGNEIYPIGANNSKFPIRILFWIKLKRMIKSLHLQKSFDVIHAFWYDEVTYVSSKTAKELGVPLFCTFMGQDALANNSYHKRIKLPPNNLIALSEFQKNQIQTNFDFDIKHIIPWGVLDNKEHSSEKTFDIINVGSFNTVKNQKEAVEIIKEISIFHPEIKCCFVGDGAYLGPVKTMVNNYDLEENIFFKGRLDRKQTLELIAQSKILLHSSNYESFGMIFAEAIMGRTMIVSKNVGIASDKEWWKIYQNKEEAVGILDNLLKSPKYPDENDSKEYAIQQTVMKYVNLWSTKKGRT